MSYSGRVSSENIRKEERRLIIFATAFVALFFLMCFSSIKFDWLSGNVLYTLGSYLVFSSVLQIRYFDVKKRSNPHFANVQPGDYSKKLELVESVFKHLWVMGSLILFVAHWVRF